MFDPKTSYADVPFKIYLAVAIIATTYFIFPLSEVIATEGDFYDFMLSMTNILVISYVILPLFLFVLANSISTKKMSSLRMLRYENKSAYYHMMLKSILLIVSKFTVVLLVVSVALSLFSLNFNNEWSVFAKKYFEKNPLFLEVYSPVIYTVHSFILLVFFLLFVGLAYFVVLILTKNRAFSLLVIIALVVSNMAITISKIALLMPFSFTRNLDFLHYIYIHKSASPSIPVPLYLYWFGLLVVTYLIGYKLVHTIDLEVTKGI